MNEDLVELVVTTPRKRRARRVEATPVAAVAAERDLPLVETGNVNAAEPLAAVTAAAPRVLVVVSFGQILRDAILALPELGPLNLHFSLLPRWRGAAPVQRAILAGDTETGVCVQRMVAALDAGAVLAEARTPIGEHESAPELRERLSGIGAPLLLDVVRRLLAGDPPPDREQDPAAVTLAPKIRRDEGRLDCAAEGAVELARRVRALRDWPTCRAVLVRPGRKDVEVRVLEAHAGGATDRAAVDDPAAATDGAAGAGAPGVVLSADAQAIVVAAREGALAITLLKRAGKRAMTARDFLNGCPVQPGDRLLPELAE